MNPGGNMTGGAGPLLLAQATKSRTGNVAHSKFFDSSKEDDGSLSRVDTFARRLSILDLGGFAKQQHLQQQQQQNSGPLFSPGGTEQQVEMEEATNTKTPTSGSHQSTSAGAGSVGSKELLLRQVVGKMQNHLSRAFNGWKMMARNSSREYKQIFPCIQILRKPRAERSEADMTLVMQHLKEVKFFMDLEVDLQRELIRTLEVEVVEEDKVLMCEGDVGTQFYIILCGQVAVYKGQPKEEELTEGRQTQQLLINFKTGDSFGELALIKDGRRGAAIVTDKETVFATMEKTDYLRTIRMVYERNVRERVDFLCRIPAFNSTSLPRLRDLCMYFQYSRFHVDNVIAQQGGEQNSVYFIITGKVSIEMKLKPKRGVGGKKTSGGARVILGWKGPGDIIGESVVLQDECNRASAIAKSEVEVLKLSAQDFNARLHPITINLFREIARGYPSEEMIEVCMSQQDRWAEYKGVVVDGIMKDHQAKRQTSLNSSHSQGAKSSSSSSSSGGGGGGSKSMNGKEQNRRKGHDSFKLIESYRNLASSDSFLSRVCMKSDSAGMSLQEESDASLQTREVELHNMLASDTESTYVDFLQGAAILKVNLLSADGDDEYLDIGLLDEIYLKWNQLATRFHALCARFTHSTFIAVIAEADRSPQENLEKLADMIHEMEEQALLCVNNIRDAQGMRDDGGSGGGGEEATTTALADNNGERGQTLDSREIVIAGALVSGNVFVTIRGSNKFVSELYGDGDERADKLCEGMSVKQLGGHQMGDGVTLDIRIDEETVSYLGDNFEVSSVYSRATAKRRMSMVDVMQKAISANTVVRYLGEYGESAVVDGVQCNPTGTGQAIVDKSQIANAASVTVSRRRGRRGGGYSQAQMKPTGFRLGRRKNDGNIFGVTWQDVSQAQVKKVSHAGSRESVKGRSNMSNHSRNNGKKSNLRSNNNGTKILTIN